MVFFFIFFIFSHSCYIQLLSKYKVNLTPSAPAVENFLPLSHPVDLSSRFCFSLYTSEARVVTVESADARYSESHLKMKSPDWIASETFLLLPSESREYFVSPETLHNWEWRTRRRGERGKKKLLSEPFNLWVKWKRKKKRERKRIRVKEHEQCWKWGRRSIEKNELNWTLIGTEIRVKEKTETHLYFKWRRLSKTVSEQWKHHQSSNRIHFQLQVTDTHTWTRREGENKNYMMHMRMNKNQLKKKKKKKKKWRRLNYPSTDAVK